MEFKYLSYGLLLLPAVAQAQQIGVSVGPSSPSSYQLNITSNTTAPNSTSAYKMQGMAGSITPQWTGTVLVTFSGTIYEPAGTAATIGINYQLSYGTGTAPTNNSTLTGTQFGIIQSNENGATVTAADMLQPYSITAIITGLAIGTTYWLDLAAESIGTASDQGFSTTSITAAELP